MVRPGQCFGPEELARRGGYVDNLRGAYHRIILGGSETMVNQNEITKGGTNKIPMKTLPNIRVPNTQIGENKDAQFSSSYRNIVRTLGGRTRLQVSLPTGESPKPRKSQLNDGEESMSEEYRRFRNLFFGNKNPL